VLGDGRWEAVGRLAGGAAQLDLDGADGTPVDEHGSAVRQVELLDLAAEDGLGDASAQFRRVGVGRQLERLAVDHDPHPGLWPTGPSHESTFARVFE
jgi:hypothetical protein